MTRFVALAMMYISIAIVPAQMYGQMYFTPGGHFGTSFNSHTRLDGRRLFEANPGVGLNIDFETGSLLGISLLAGANYSVYTGQAEYSFVNTDNGQSARVSDLDSTWTMISFLVGVRVRPINGRIKFILGGGVLAGGSDISHDQTDFLNKNGSLNGYQVSSEASFHGTYLESSLGYFWNPKNGLTLNARKMTINTNNYATLGNNSFKTELWQIAVQYNHIVDLSFFWK